jgi:hypothetical protein
MKAYQVILTKSYIITVNAETKETAKFACEFYADDIKDISTNEDRKNKKFEIENIECTINEAVECMELETT